VLHMPQEWALCITVSIEEEGAREDADTTTSTETQLDEFATKFEKDFSLSPASLPAPTQGVLGTWTVVHLII
jgi:hypothetical protein